MSTNAEDGSASQESAHVGEEVLGSVRGKSLQEMQEQINTEIATRQANHVQFIPKPGVIDPITGAVTP